MDTYSGQFMHFEQPIVVSVCNKIFFCIRLLDNMVKLGTMLHYCISLASMTSLASWIPTSRNLLRLEEDHNRKVK